MVYTVVEKMELKIARGIFILSIYICFISILKTTAGLPINIPGNVQKITLNKTLFQRFSWSGDGRGSSVKQCRLFPKTNDTVNNDTVIRSLPIDTDKLEEVSNAIDLSQLIEYTFELDGYNENLFSKNNSFNYKLENWARTVSGNGQNILNLAFNYDILSLGTLSLGVTRMKVILEDYPLGCLRSLNEDEKMMALLDIVMRDLNPDGQIKIHEGESSVCHQLIKIENGRAKFIDQCCYKSKDNEDIYCVADIHNEWLDVLHILLRILTIGVFIFGPMMIPEWFYVAAMDTFQYYINLKEPLYKTIAVCRKDKSQDIDYERVMDLRNISRKDFKLCRRIIAELPEDKVIPIKISQFDIEVDYKKLLPENKVPVGLFNSLSRAIFLCKIRELGAFKSCCDASITGCLCSNKEDNPPAWFSVCNLLGRFLIVFFVPFPFYIRLIFYYLLENQEIMDRQNAAQKLGYGVSFNSRLLQFLTPTHPFYIAIYVIYFMAGFSIAYCSAVDKKTRLQQTIMDAFKDLKDLSMLHAVEMFIRNCLWPFKKYGVFGMFIGIITWPILVPISIALCLIYCLPLIFICLRIILHTFTSNKINKEEEKRERYKPAPLHFEADEVLQKMKTKSPKISLKCENYTPNVLKLLVNLALSIMAIAALFAVLFIISEIFVFVAEIVAFTTMGIIVNATLVLRYVTLLFLVVLYSYDCYSNVTKKYLKLNKALFSEVKHRLVKDIDQYTQLPYDFQENRGFKSVEASGQAEYEAIDDVSEIPYFHWDINDLILFMDKHDMPRIPKKLFDEVCDINVPGAPGPVYWSLIMATKKFMLIICFLAFVFVVVSSFNTSGDTTKNYTLIAMAGGLAPLMFKYVFKPGKVNVETSLLSFKSKLEEIIKNFNETWPMHDFVFDIEEEPAVREYAEGEENGSESDADESDNETTFFKQSHTDLSVPFNSDSGETNIKSKRTKGCSDNIKKKSDKDWLAKITKVTRMDSVQIQKRVNDLVLEPAAGQKVDILIYVGENEKDWNYDISLNEYMLDDVDGKKRCKKYKCKPFSKNKECIV